MAAKALVKPDLRTLPPAELHRSNGRSVSPCLTNGSKELPPIRLTDRFKVGRFNRDELRQFLSSRPELTSADALLILDAEFLGVASLEFGYSMGGMESLVRHEIKCCRAPDQQKQRLCRSLSSGMACFAQRLRDFEDQADPHESLWTSLFSIESHHFGKIRVFLFERNSPAGIAHQEVRFESLTAPCGVPTLRAHGEAMSLLPGLACERLFLTSRGMHHGSDLCRVRSVVDVLPDAQGKPDSPQHSLLSLQKKSTTPQRDRCTKPYCQAKSRCRHRIPCLSIPEGSTVFTVGRGRQASRYFIVITPPSDEDDFLSFHLPSSSGSSGPSVESSDEASDCSSSFVNQPAVRKHQCSPQTRERKIKRFLELVDSPNVPYWYRFKAPFEDEFQEKKPHVRKQLLQLGPITSHRLSLKGLRELDLDRILDGVLDIIESEEAARKMLKPDYKKHMVVQRVSYNMKHCAPVLLESGIAAVVPPDCPLFHTVTAFLVHKKDLLGRFILDAAILTKMFELPAKMQIDQMHIMIRRILRWDSAFIYDGVSMFYQFPINDFLSWFLAFRLGGARGTSHIIMRLLVLCMGWTWAPLIAHTSARVICGPTESFPFVDNFAVEGSTENNEAFLSRCRKAELEIRREDNKDWNAPPSTEFEHLGVLYDLLLHRFCLAEKTRSQASEIARTLEEFSLRKDPLSATDLFVAIGYISYMSFVVGEPAALHYDVIRLARWVARVAHDDWQRPIFAPDSTLFMLWSRLRYLSTQRWYKERDLPSPETCELLQLWTDASDLCAGIVVSKLKNATPDVMECISRNFAEGLLASHIYTKESVAFHQGYVQLQLPKYQPYRYIRSYLDNFALLLGFLKGRSSVELVNDVIRSLYFSGKGEGGVLFEVGWVSTLCMLADYPSRQKQVPSQPLPPCEDVRCTACHASPVQPRWMSFVAATSSDTPSQDVSSWPGFLATPFAPLPKANTKDENKPWQEESLQAESRKTSMSATPAPTEMVQMNPTDWRVTDADDANEVVYTPSSVLSIEASAKE